MHFPVSGVDCAVWLPPLVAFLVALLTTPAGISGAFLLLPFQMSVLGFVSPAVTPTNLLYNIVATPGGIYRYIREHRMDWALAGAIIAGTLPGVFIGAAIRIHYLPNPLYFKLFVAFVLLYLGARLLWAAGRVVVERADAPVNSMMLTLVALPVGIIGGIYGVGGAAIIAPFAVTIMHLPARKIAGPALLGTLITSIGGIASFIIAAKGPDWSLGLLFGLGGLAGSYCGARLQKHLPERWIRLSLAILVLATAVSYISQFALAKRT
jgi:hypothetical protein